MFIQKLLSIDSTSTYVKVNLSTLPKIGCVIAETQTGGRGQFLRPWISPLGGIYMTLFFPWPQDLPPPREMSLNAARLVQQIFVLKGFAIALKWPNDLLLNKKKLGGILTEIVDHTILIGIGLNINTPQEAFQGLDQPATSLFIETGKTYDIDLLIEEIRIPLIRELQPR